MNLISHFIRLYLVPLPPQCLTTRSSVLIFPNWTFCGPDLHSRSMKTHWGFDLIKTLGAFVQIYNFYQFLRSKNEKNRPLYIILTKWPIGRYSDKVSALYPDYSHVFSSTDLIKMGHIQKMKILKYDFFQLIIWYFMSGVKINNAQPSFISQRILKMFFYLCNL